jgi:hypothetical protein
MPELTCFRLLDAESPAGPLAEAVHNLNSGQSTPIVYMLDSISFKQVPNAPFAYWVEDSVRRTFKKLPPFGTGGRTARQGLATADNFRFVRCWWEVTAQNNDSTNRLWWLFAKGGAYSPYYADLHLVINWRANGAEIRCRDVARVQNEGFFLRPGLTWTHRTTSTLSFRVFPCDAVFDIKGPTAFIDGNNDQLLGYLGLLNSKNFIFLVNNLVGAADSAARSYDNGIINLMPVPLVGNDVALNQFKELSTACWNAKRGRDTINELSHAFVVPWLSDSLNSLHILESELQASQVQLDSFIAKKQADIDQISEKIYGFKVPESSDVFQTTESNDIDDEEDNNNNIDAARMLVSYLIGVAFRRWTIPVNPDNLRRPPMDPFASLPVQAPGAAPALNAKLYFVEENSGESTLLSGCRDALRQATGLSSIDNYEQDLVTRLGVSVLSEYISRPSAFFADHLKVYSKSRRKAPIYWPLSTKSGNFTIWVYYPQLDSQSLPKLIADVLSPKIRTLTQEIENRRATPGGKIAELELSRQELEEMRTDFTDLINRGYLPNQNDGVLITACPLAKYFRHAGFRKELEACWKKLSQGDFDWAHLAMSMWPQRVLEVCKKDRSIAIAHGREELFPAEPVKAKRASKKSKSDD